MNRMSFLDKYVLQEKSIAPLITFRVLFGFIMAVSIVRFALHGWINELYIEPSFFFTYYGFDWIRPLGSTGMYLLFGLVFTSSIGIMIGFFYRFSAVIFFLSFTYIELIDKTNYLNHYYFVSIVAFILIWLPAHRSLSLDVQSKRISQLRMIPCGAINILKIQLIIVYFFAGLAKLNPYWIFEASPLKFWLPAKSHVPVIGHFFQYKWVAYAFSWLGALYDLTISFFLLFRKTRVFAYATVLIFHLMTALLFQIGMFPYIMILCTLIFFDASWHEKVHKKVLSLFHSKEKSERVSHAFGTRLLFFKKPVVAMLVLFMAFQLVLPFRYLLYPGDLFWTEQGYRFSWRVMLMEKAGHTSFRVEDESGKIEWVQNFDYLSPQQEKMMSTQPDMILHFAHYLEEQYQEKGFINPKVFCDSKVTMNGRRSQRFVDASVDLTKVRRGFSNKSWIEPFDK